MFSPTAFCSTAWNGIPVGSRSRLQFVWCVCGSPLSSLSQRLPWPSEAPSLAFHYPMPRACCENQSFAQSKPSILETLGRTQKSPSKGCVQKQILSIIPWDSWTLSQNHKAQGQAFLPAGLPAVPLKSRKRNPHWHVPC